MNLPSVQQCIICEAIRQEIGNKVTLMGFFGFLPDTSILLDADEFDISLSFLVSLSQEKGDFRVSASLLNPSGNPLVQTAEASFQPNKKSNYLLLGFPRLRCEQEGRYALTVFVDGHEVYRGFFSMSRSLKPEVAPS
jgi:hypothetical protein